MASLDTSTASCAACGKEGGNLNTCNKCKMVKYCNAVCKKKHCSKHKKACEKRVAELHDEALFKEPPPPEDCPICFLPLPIDTNRTLFSPCCGKTICCGCICVMAKEAYWRRKKKIFLCAFCRTPACTSDKEEDERIMRQVEADNANSFNTLGGWYETGDYGMPQDMTKANEFHRRAGELGCSEGYYNLGNSYCYGRGVEVDKKKAKHYYELAAMTGGVKARHNLGYMEGDVDNHHRAMKHFVLAANAGFKPSLDWVKKGFMKGYVTKDEYANTLRAYQSRHDEMKSDNRDKAEEFY